MRCNDIAAHNIIKILKNCLMSLDSTFRCTESYHQKYIWLKKKIVLFPNTSFTQSLNWFYSYVLLYRNCSIGLHWENAGKHLWRIVLFSANIQKMTVHQLFLKDFANVNQPEDVLITGTLNLVMKWVNGSSNGSWNGSITQIWDFCKWD